MLELELLLLLMYVFHHVLIQGREAFFVLIDMRALYLDAKIVLEEMQSQGLVAEDNEFARSAWQLTEKGHRSLNLRTTLHNPKRLLNHDHKAMRDWITAQP